jgi:GNAT superfamily N-acetyltransferase
VHIRDAAEADIPYLVELGRAMHFESRYARFDFDPAKYATVLAHVIPQGLTFIAEQDGEVIGVFVGVLDSMFFGHDIVARDLLTYVAPERRGRAGVGLIREYVRRAKALGAADIHIGVSTGLQPERTGRLYERLGFSHIGGGYAMEV